VRAPEHDDTDAQLLSRIAEGDHDALVDLYGRHAAWLLVRLRRRCAVEELVDNALQDTFVSAWRNASEYRAERGEAGAWLWTIAVRRLIDQLRHRAPPTPVDFVPDPGQLPPPGTPANELLAGLAPDLQGVVEAVYLDGLTVNEAAVLLGIPAGTVKSRLSRARTELKGVLR
jgi:RNA polymerase sigma-70 factor, ECF subfamily